jgi:four helix bundle protein
MARAKFDLDDRLLEFGVRACRVAERLPQSPVARHIGLQLARAATSPAANYAEAQAAESRRDFVHKLRICAKELREARVWLRFIRRMELCPTAPIEPTCDECEQLVAIVSASIRTATGGSAAGRRKSQCSSLKPQGTDT